MAPTPTTDPHVWIESQKPGYIRYWRDSDNRRWEVRGTCKRLGECMVGATMPDGTYFATLQDVLNYAQAMGAKTVIDGLYPQGLDCPVTPEFNDCCARSDRGYLTFTELPAGPYQGK